MNIKPIFIPPLSIILICIIIFLIVPNAAEIFSFSGIKFLKGEVWRILTFSFTHINLDHLIENSIVLMVVALLAYEFGLRGKLFITYFSLVSILIALLDLFLFPSIIIAGASLGIYGVLGGLSMKGSHFISRTYILSLFGITIFLRSILDFLTKTSFTVSIQSLLHFSGFIVGIALVSIPRKFKKEKHILNRQQK